MAEERARQREESERQREESARQREESVRQREESERRIAEMRRQMERLQEMFHEQSSTAAPVKERRSAAESIKVTRLTEEDDIESYLTTFERIMAANEVGRDRWSFHLAPNLTGKAQQAYTALPPEDAKTYETVKEAILRRYDIHEETYRQRFRKLRPQEGESPQEVITHLKDLATRWAREHETRDDLLDLIVREQFLAILPEDIRVAVIQRQPKDSQEASKIVENYLQARSASIADKGVETPSEKRLGSGQREHDARECPDRDSYERETRTHSTDGVKCFRCHQRGHLAFQCPQRTSLYCA